MAHSLSLAKNSIRKTLWGIVDKEPTKRELKVLWAHFESQCAYCGMALKREERKGHIDHLEANRSIGRNHISNRVLACHICNGDQKREMDWQQFLALKCGDDQALYVSRRSTILEWCSKCGVSPAPDAAIVSQVQRSIETCNAVLDQEADRIKSILPRPQLGSKTANNKRKS